MAGLINGILSMFVLAIFVRSILSWFPISPVNPFKLMVFQLTEPVLAPLRRYLPQFGSIDLAPMVTIIVVLFLIQPLVRRILS